MAVNANEERQLYEFGPFKLDASERVLSRDGAPVPLPPKSLDTLIVLVRGEGRLVGKDELMKAIWPDTFVEEANLNHHVWALRKVLSEGENSRGYIETVPRRGYRFVADEPQLPDADGALVLEKHTFKRIVTEEAEETWPERVVAAEARPRIVALSPPHVSPRLRISTSLKIAAACLAVLLGGAVIYSQWSSRGAGRVEAAAPGRAALQSIAVLPFKTIGAETDDSTYLGLGLSDALIIRMGTSRRLIVRPTSAVRRYADPLQNPLVAGREQDVEAVLDGSVQRAGDQIRVTVQLLRTRDGASLWSAKFDERFTDIFAVQDSISRQVMRELLVELNPEEALGPRRRGGENIEAYEAYLKGLHFWNKRSRAGYQKAIEYFSRAVEIDPNYAEAYVGLGNAFAYLGGHDLGSQAEAISKQRALTLKALELDDTLAEAHATLGLISMNDAGDWPKAETEFKRALALSPNYATAHQWYGEFLAWMGRFDEGIAESRRARELDPLSLIISTDVAKVYLLSGRYDDAVAQFKRALELDPEFGVAHGLLALTYSKQGRHEEALRELRGIRDLESDPMHLSYLVYVYGQAGMRDEAGRALRRLSDLSRQTYVIPQWRVLAYAGLGDKDEAFKWLDRSFDEHDQGKLTVKVSPVLDNLRSDPRFSAVMRRAGF